MSEEVAPGLDAPAVPEVVSAPGVLVAPETPDWLVVSGGGVVVDVLPAAPVVPPVVLLGLAVVPVVPLAPVWPDMSVPADVPLVSVPVALVPVPIEPVLGLEDPLTLPLLVEPVPVVLLGLCELMSPVPVPVVLVAPVVSVVPVAPTDPEGLVAVPVVPVVPT